MRTIEVQGVNYNNKGAELMLEACREHFRGRAKVVLHFRAGSFRRRHAAKLGHLMRMHRERFPGSNAVMTLAVGSIPNRIRGALDLWTEDALDGVVDASGFQYSDQWGLSIIELMATRARRLKRAGRKVVLLPQAFGPFDSGASKRAMAEIIINSDLVFARDAVSVEHLAGTLGGALPPHVLKYPDFTNLLVPPVNATPRLAQTPTLVLVPNARMIDKTSAAERSHYPELMARVARRGAELGFTVALMVHDWGEDDRLADAIERTLPFRPLRLEASDPLVLKSMLAQADVVVASRFHALVGALSSGTPSIAIGWSHKYGELMRDYDLGEASLEAGDIDRVSALLEAWSSEATRSRLRETLTARAAELKKLSLQMWARVDAVLES